jgi:3-oxoacyl-[acyl-carrier protein] reductase
MSERKVVIITGAGTGVGAASATRLAEHGYNVVVNYNRSAAEAESVADSCRAYGEAIAVQGDVSDDSDCRRIAKAALEKWNRIDALVNNAGTTQFISMDDLEALNAENFDIVNKVNVIGPFQMTRAVAPHIKKYGGAIVNVSSLASVQGSGSSHAYAASKGALNTLTLSLARSLAPEIRVNAVLPGMIQGRWVKEGIGEESYERVKKQYSESSALGTVCTPEQVANVIGWLVTSADVITGQLITVDAGMSLGKPPTIAR